MLVIVGSAIVVTGLLLWSDLVRNWLGRLPGDIYFKRDNFTFYFPIITCLLLSLLITILLRVFKK